MTTPQTIEQEVIAVTGVKLRKDRVKFLEAVLHALDGVPDDKWKQLSEPAQNWFNAASPLYNDGKAIPDFPDVSETATEPEEQPEEISEDTVTTTAKPAKPAKKGTAPPKSGAAKAVAKAAAKANGAAPAGNKKAAAPPKAAKPAAAPRTKSGGESEGAPTIIRRAVIENPQVTSADINTDLRQRGVKCSPLTVSSIRSATLSTLRMLKERGHLKGISL